ncbi:MAG TPA: hypothetical protein VNU21_02880 [Usitatibacter sp.]|nr:hypothetical protein [Usitatibacter sp.]
MRIARLSAALAVTAWALAGSVRGDDLGTLFFSPEERARLDQQRRGELAPPPKAAAAATTERGRPAAPVRPPVLTGYVQRSDGRDTVWIDGRPVVTTAPQASTLEPSKVGQDFPAGVHVERKSGR